MDLKNRLTLEKLIAHVESLCGVVEEVNNIELPGKIEHIDKIAYNTLDYGITSSIMNIPPNIRILFEPYLNNIKRHGVMNINEEFNYSLYFSILMCISDKFNTYEYNDQVIMINVLQESLLQSLNNLYDTHNYIKLGWKKTDLRNAIQKFEFNKMILQYISDYLYVNIFLVNISDDKLYLTYSEEYFNIYKGNIFLSYYNNTFEPLSFSDSKIIDYQNPILKKIINVHKKNINLMTLNLTKNATDKIFEVKNEDLQKYLKKQDTTPDTKPDTTPDTTPDTKPDTKPDTTPDTKPVTKPVENKKESKKESKKVVNKVVNKEDNKVDNKVDNDVCKEENKFTEVGFDDIPKLNNKMKLDYIQDIARKYNISLECGTLSNGKTKYKTKDALIVEIKNISQ